jgi:hypothetical protein
MVYVVWATSAALDTALANILVNIKRALANSSTLKNGVCSISGIGHSNGEYIGQHK